MGFKRKPAEPLKPHHEKGVVVVRIPKGTPPAEASKAITWARNLAKKYSQSWAW